jgi:transposase-like protein
MPQGRSSLRSKSSGSSARLRLGWVGFAQGKTLPEVVRKLGVTEQTYYRWKREYGGLRTEQAKRLKDLEKEVLPGTSWVGGLARANRAA